MNRLGLAAVILGLALSGSGTGLAQARPVAVVYGPDEVEERPMLKSAPTFRYPERLRPYRLQGEVWIEFIVSPDGKVDSTSMTVVSTPDQRLVDEAKRRVLSLQFYPGTVGGRPVAVRVRMPVSFRLR